MEGATTANGQLAAYIIHTGSETIIYTDNDLHRFTHAPIVKEFQFEYPSTPTTGVRAPQAASIVQAANFAATSDGSAILGYLAQPFYDLDHPD